MDCGAFISTIALIFSGSGLTPSGVSRCPKNLQSVDLNCIFFGFSERLFILAVSSRVNSLPSCSILVVPCVRISSAMPWTPSSSQSTLSSLSWKTSLAIFSPNDRWSHLNFPQGVLKVVIKLLAKSSSTCQYPEVASLSVLYLELANSGSISSIVLEYH